MGADTVIQMQGDRGLSSWLMGSLKRSDLRESCEVESPALRDLMGRKHVQERPWGEKRKRETGEDTQCVGQGSRWQVLWSAGSAGTVVLALGQDSFQTAQQSWEWVGWRGDPRLSRKGTQNRRGQGRSLKNTC